MTLWLIQFGGQAGDASRWQQSLRLAGSIAHARAVAFGLRQRYGFATLYRLDEHGQWDTVPP